MAVGSAAHDAIPFLLQRFCQRPGIGEHLALISAERLGGRLAETDRLCRHHVHQGSSLVAWENRPVDLGRKLFFAEDHASTRAAKRLMRSGSNDVGMLTGIWVQSCCNQARIM